MYIKERNGKFRYFQDYKDPLTEKRKTVSCTLNSKSRAAQKQARIILTERIEKALEKSTLSPVQKNIRLCDAIDKWLEFRKNNTKRSTYISLKCTFQSQINKYFDEDTLLRNITPHFIEKKIDYIQYNSGLRVNTVKNMYYRLNTFFKWAKQSEYIDKNPMKEVEIVWKREEAPNIENKFLEDDEMQAILDYTWNENKPYAALIEWLYLTGMRFGEAASLKFDDIKNIDGTYFASVTGTLNYLDVSSKSRSKSNSPKTKKSVRDIELSKRAIEILNFEKKMPHKSSFIFETQNGTPYHPVNINQYLKRVESKLGLNKHLTTHIFRHTHISKLAELGVPLYVIKERVGHSSNVTEKIYLHVTKKAKRKLISELDNL